MLLAAIDPSVQAAVVTTIGLIVVALLGLIAEGLRRNHVATRSIKKDTRASREQVQNDHSTNLRDDVDRILEVIEKVAATTDSLVDGQHRLGEGLRTATVRLDQLRADQTQSRVDQAQERQERLAADERIGHHIESVAATAVRVQAALEAQEKTGRRRR